MSTSRFKAVAAPFGLGTGGYQLVPFRTIAVDRSQIPLGSVIYIPAARGVSITLPSGEQVLHDGYFFAADVGGAIRGNHIDVFIGVADRNPFPFVKSRASGSFEAYLVEDPEISRILTAMHRR
jgi:3D (Asp-Asp-Asp) domain-containing protein